jgi:cysteine desulfurase/selenocysteine lyase
MSIDRLANEDSFRVLRSEVVGIEKLVPLLDGTSRPYIYLDNAASAPALRSVQRKVNDFLAWYSSVHRGSGFKSLLSTAIYDRAREIVSDFVGADPARDCVIFGKNTTEAINKLANRMNLKTEDVILTTSMEHHSNDLPWRDRCLIRYISVTPEGELDLDDLDRKLQASAGKVKLVAMTGASNVSGFINPMHQVAEMAHQAGAYLFVDCAQLAPHRTIRMGKQGDPGHLDFVALSAHKMYAPFGSGALIGPRGFFASGSPDIKGGGTVEVVSLEEVFWADPPERDEAGSPNVVGAVALAAAIQRLEEVGMEVVATHESDLTTYALERLGRLDGIRLFGSTDPARTHDRLGVISFLVQGVPPGKVSAILGFEGGIGVRSGCFCAHPYVMKLLGMGQAEYETFKQRALRHDRSTLPGLVRASFGCFSNREDIDHLVNMLERILAGKIQGDYICDMPSGSYFPRGYDPAVLNDYYRL